jgi:hypothetical protein
MSDSIILNEYTDWAKELGREPTEADQDTWLMEHYGVKFSDLTAEEQQDLIHARWDEQKDVLERIHRRLDDEAKKAEAAA